MEEELFSSKSPIEEPCIKFLKLNSEAILPQRKKDGDAGLDLYALQDIVVPSMFSVLNRIHKPEATKVGTGIACQLPPGHVGLIWDRSGLGSKLIKVFGGVIDSSYTGEILVCLANFSFTDYSIEAGDRIAQLVVQKYEPLQCVEVSELMPTVRGTDGFGSSGK